VLITGFATGATEANCYLVAQRPGAGAIVIDPGEQAVPTLEYYFAVNELSPEAVLLTHGHVGHSASASELCDGWNIPVYVHPADRALLADPVYGEPDLVAELTDGAELNLAGIRVWVDHTPGHTDGSVTFRMNADTEEGRVDVVFTGDTLLCRRVGSAADPARLLASVRDKLLVLDDDTVMLPGHGTSSTIGAERRFNSTLKDLTA
jgi:glyoxylase-like metal-dependent hydrolase (beta-lactamase superfamily II)